MRSRLRRLFDSLSGTPLHPQWLMSSENLDHRVIKDMAFGCVLDIGCSTRWVEELLSKDSKYIGLDYPATGIGMYGARPDVFGDASALPFKDECMNAVVFFETLEHVSRPVDAINEIARVLRSGGCLLMTVPFLYPLHDEPFDFTRYTAHGLRRILEEAGLKIEVLRPSMGSAETAGLIVALSLAGMTMQAVRSRSLAMVLLPLTALVIPISNIFFWVVGKVMPSWPAIPAGYHVIARK